MKEPNELQIIEHTRSNHSAHPKPQVSLTGEASGDDCLITCEMGNSAVD